MGPHCGASFWNDEHVHGCATQDPLLDGPIPNFSAYMSLHPNTVNPYKISHALLLLYPFHFSTVANLQFQNITFSYQDFRKLHSVIRTLLNYVMSYNQLFLLLSAAAPWS